MRNLSRTLSSKNNNMQRQLKEESPQNKSLTSKSLRKDHFSLPHKGSSQIAGNCQAVSKIETHSLVWFSMTCRILWMPNVAAQKLPAGRDPSKTTAVMSWRLGSAAALRWAGASCFGGRSPSVRSSLWSAIWQILVPKRIPYPGRMDQLPFVAICNSKPNVPWECSLVLFSILAKQTTVEPYCQWQNRSKSVSTSWGWISINIDVNVDLLALH